MNLICSQFGGLSFGRSRLPFPNHSFFTRLRAALAELDRSAWENMMNTCITPVTRAIPTAVNATPLHVDRSCVHLKNWMAPNKRRHAQKRVTCSIRRNRESVSCQWHAKLLTHLEMARKCVELWICRFLQGSRNSTTTSSTAQLNSYTSTSFYWLCRVMYR